MSMTDTEINCALAEMEGECIFEGNGKLCDKCGRHRSNHHVPDRLNDAAYIWGLVIKLYENGCELRRHEDYGAGLYIYQVAANESAIGNFEEIILSEDKFPKRAVALAWIEKWKVENET